MTRRATQLTLLLAVAIGWSGCDYLGGNVEDGEEVVGGTYDLSSADHSLVDADYKNQNTLGPDSYGGYYVEVQAGSPYFIWLDVKSGGSVKIYVSSHSQIVIGDEETSKIAVTGNGDWFTPNWSGKMYVLLLSGQSGTIVETGVYTYEPGGELPAGAVELSVNDIMTEGKLLQDQAHLYYFEARGGSTYKILTQTGSGSIDVYAGTSPAVGESNHEFQDSYGNDGIDVQYAGDVTVHVLVEDRGNNLGSEYFVRVYSFDEASLPMPEMVGLTVNDVFREGNLMPGEIHRFSFYMNYGNTYEIIASSPTGSIDMFAGELSCVDDQVYSASDSYGNDGIELLESESSGEHYVAVVDRGNALGSTYTIRVASYDESSPMVPSNVLNEGTALQAQHVTASGIQRYKVLAQQGKKYRVAVDVEEGSTDTFMSVIASVDAQVHEDSDSYSDDDIVFLAEETGNYYVAIVDRGNEMGSDFSILLTEE